MYILAGSAPIGNVDPLGLQRDRRGIDELERPNCTKVFSRTGPAELENEFVGLLLMVFIADTGSRGKRVRGGSALWEERSIKRYKTPGVWTDVCIQPDGSVSLVPLGPGFEYSEDAQTLQSDWTQGKYKRAGRQVVTRYPPWHKLKGVPYIALRVPQYRGTIGGRAKADVWLIWEWVEMAFGGKTGPIA
jgi:hypothetical protein